MGTRRRSADIAKRPGVPARRVDATGLAASACNAREQELPVLGSSLLAIELTDDPLDVLRQSEKVADGLRLVVHPPLHHAAPRSMSSAMIAAIVPCSSAGMKRA